MACKKFGSATVHRNYILKETVKNTINVHLNQKHRPKNVNVNKRLNTYDLAD